MYRRQILTSKVSPRTEMVNVVSLAAIPAVTTVIVRYSAIITKLLSLFGPILGQYKEQIHTVFAQYRANVQNVGLIWPN